jgi:hypothetical protein
MASDISITGLNAIFHIFTGGFFADNLLNNEAEEMGGNLAEQFKSADAVRVVAHSQGTNITMHALSKLCSEKEECCETKCIKIVLFAPKIEAGLAASALGACANNKCYDVRVMWISPDWKDVVPDQNITHPFDPMPPRGRGVLHRYSNSGGHSLNGFLKERNKKLNEEINSFLSGGCD